MPVIRNREGRLLVSEVVQRRVAAHGYPSLMMFTRITVDADRMGGLPCIRGLRFPVASVVAMVADGMSVNQILGEHPDLEAEDIAESLRYAALAVQKRELPLRQPA